MNLKLLQIKETSGEKICSPEAVAKLMQEEAKADRECFWILHLNSANTVIEKELISIGLVNGSLIHSREVFKKAILNGAINIVTIHNHPGGQIKPSKEDKTAWEKLDKAGEILGINVIDHLVITPNGQYYSNKEEKNYGHKK